MLSVAILVLASVIAVAGYVHGLRSSAGKRRSKAGFYGLGLLAFLLAGLLISGQAGNDPAAFGFGIAVSLALPGMLLFGIFSAIGQAIRNRSGGSK